MEPRFPLPDERTKSHLEKTMYANKKKTWLKEVGKPLHGAPKWEDIPEGFCAVCCIDNGMFQAAAIAYCPGELEDCKDPTDRRPKQWFLLEKKLAIENSTIRMEDFHG